MLHVIIPRILPFKYKLKSTVATYFNYYKGEFLSTSAPWPLSPALVVDGDGVMRNGGVMLRLSKRARRDVGGAGWGCCTHLLWQTQSVSNRVRPLFQLYGIQLHFYTSIHLYFDVIKPASSDFLTLVQNHENKNVLSTLINN